MESLGLKRLNFSEFYVVTGLTKNSSYRSTSKFISISDSYVKVTYSVLSKVHKVKKTTVQKSANEPFYNQTLEFKIDQSGMDVACLNFEVFHNTSGIGKTDKSLGSFIVGGSLVARGKELDHWANMIQKPQTVVKEWHQLKM